jgi:ATP-dependent DNA helicase DinG
LFAAGALWEGIDIPGDALSMLIIVKLPFPVPDPISEYERSLYNSFEEYKWGVIFPEAAIKTKQGHGRGLRVETDTCVIAMLDCRMRIGAPYRDCFLEVLPPCYVTCDIAEVTDYIRAVKSEEYFSKLMQ